MNIESITLSGMISGLIWMPCTECEKQFSKTYAPKESKNSPFVDEWTGLRDAVCDITNDGDFRNAAIDYMYIEVVYRISPTEKKVKGKEVKAGKLIADCFN